MLIIHSRRSLTIRHVNIWHIIILICTCLTLIAYESSFAAPETITTFLSPYMNAVDTELATVDNGATVGADTKAYWDLHPDAGRLTAYPEPALKTLHPRSRL